MVLFKLDFEKAVDSANWGYLEEIMNLMGFGQKWNSWVCFNVLKHQNITVLVNGAIASSSNMERGLKQGDPLYPFLSILAAEGLNSLISQAQCCGLFKGVEVDSWV